ncbi:family 20 glycosylhydrolase [Psychrobacillus antarcticus]|uniref:family 20 glycosylhydrolase n=1 Tax=Psychrobacillus antarcticus TaxID=2879115 RepID=UPI002407C9A5|nr:family 20 glycosylhydrolase [Psychrobacillus antarcticus]
MKYKFSPPVKRLSLKDGYFNRSIKDAKPRISVALNDLNIKNMPKDLIPEVDHQLKGFHYVLGQSIIEDFVSECEEQAFKISIDEDNIHIQGADLAGLKYGMDTFIQLFYQVHDMNLPCIEIEDKPQLTKRGLMLDLSRGKVYTLDYLKEVVDIISALRMNVLQLYVEHTFEFQSHPVISRGSSPLTPEDIKELQHYCHENHIELQANLQSLGHMNRILTRKEYQHLSESEMYWSLDTTSDETYKLLDDLYKDYLPLFDSPWLNVCSDEPYDLGKGKSKSANKEVGDLYLEHLLKIHNIAKKYGKRIMLFGDVVKEYPEYAGKMPADIKYIDWIYDPKEIYGTPSLFNHSGIPYWVSPGTGNWNTLFPRFHGSLTNIANLTLEGIANNAEGILLTDWNDHGAYSQPAPVYYSYAYASAIAWSGYKVETELISEWIDNVLSLQGYSKIIFHLAEIYKIPPIWSKNRSECVMALFDEPIMGKAINGQIPSEKMKAYDLNLPEGVEYEFERHSQHPLRPYFAVPTDVTLQIEAILDQVAPMIEKLPSGKVQRQLQFIVSAFQLIIEKLELSREIITYFDSRELDSDDFILLEDKVRVLISRFTDLQLEYVTRWFEISRRAEIHISLSYFANIISRYVYLQDWLSIQRENIQHTGVDWEFSTYETGGYSTLPTY